MNEHEVAPAGLFRRTWLAAFAAFFLITGAWSFAAPYDGTPDELQHILRAYGVVSGEIAPTLVDDAKTSGALHNVPKGLVRDICWQLKPEQSAACAVEPGGDDTLVKTNVLAGRYNPIYYGIVGWPLKMSPDMTGVIGSRLISSAGVAALLASAFALVARSRRRLLIGAFAVAVTPMVAHIGSAVNPNGWEIAAGVAFFASGIHVFLERQSSRFAYWLLGISGCLMLTLRSGGLLLFAVALLTMLVPLGLGRIKEIWGSRPLRTIFGAWVAAGLLAISWMLFMSPNALGTKPVNLGLSVQRATYEEFTRWEAYLNEFVGVLAYLDARAPAVFYIIWQILAGSLIILALIVTNRTGIIRLSVLAIGGGLIPSVVQVAFVNQAGFVNQGRYMLPVMVGIPLLSAYLIEQSGSPLAKAPAAKLARIFALILVPMHGVFLCFTMLRWQRGNGGGHNPFRGEWLPDSGPFVPVALSGLGILVLVGLIWWYTRDDGTKPVVNPPKAPRSIRHWLGGNRHINVAAVDPVQVDPVKTDPVQVDPVQVDPVQPAPERTSNVMASPANG